MATRSTPEDGDVVIREQSRDGRVVYALHVAPGADQFIERTRDAALAKARTFAERQHVRVWITDGDYDFTLVDDFRPLA